MTPERRRSPLVRLAPLGLLVLGVVLFFALDLGRFLSLDSLHRNRLELTEFVTRHGVLAALSFLAAYVVVVVFSLPVATLLSVLGGFLFGVEVGVPLVVVAATAGATLLFLIARSTLGVFLRERAGPWLARMETGIRKNELSYLLILRLVPVFPFFLVNIVPALLGVRLRNFVVATAVGIVPGVVVYVGIGAGAGTLIEEQGALGLGVFLQPAVLLPVAGLTLLAFVPIVVRRLRGT